MIDFVSSSTKDQTYFHVERLCGLTLSTALSLAPHAMQNTTVGMPLSRISGGTALKNNDCIKTCNSNTIFLPCKHVKTHIPLPLRGALSYLEISSCLSSFPLPLDTPTNQMEFLPIYSLDIHNMANGTSTSVKMKLSTKTEDHTARCRH